MSKTSKNIKEKIAGCKIFIVLGTKNYLKSLKRKNKNILNQIKIARELKKPFIIINDRRLLKNEEDDIRNYFSKDNVVKEITVDIGSKESSRIIASEIRQAMDCLYPCNDRIIDIIYPYEDDNKDKADKNTTQKH